jgi:hypothetical protein
MGENKMKHHEYATEVKHTLEKDIKKILIDTKHLTDTDKIILFEQTVGIFPMYPQLTYYGTFKAIFKDDFIIGEFQARTTNYGLTHHILTGRPLYDLNIDYDGESIQNKGNIFQPKYQRKPRFETQ